MDEQTKFRFSGKMNYDMMRLPAGRINLAFALEMVERQELARRLPEDELAYLFKHALTQDAAYSTLMKQERRRLHHIVAETLEQVYAQRPGELASLLAKHYAEAGDAEKTFQYGVQAGNAAARRSANAEACSNYDLALQALSQLPVTVQHQRDRVDTILLRVYVSLRAEGPHRTVERLREAETLAQTLADLATVPEDQLRLALVRHWIAQAHLLGGAAGEAVRYLKQVLTTAEGTAEQQELYALASSILGRGLAVQGRFDEAQPYLRVGATVLDRFATNHEWVMAVGASAVSSAARGEYAAGLAEGQRGVEGALEVKTLTSIGLARLWLSLVYQMGGDLVGWAREGVSVLDVAAQSGDLLLLYAGYGFYAAVQSRLGNHQAALESLENLKSIGQQMGGRLVFHDWFAAAQAEIALNAGRVQEAIVLSEQALNVAQEADSLFAKGLAQRVWGQALAASGGEHLDIEQHFIASLSAFEAGDARLEVARTHAAWGKFLGERGNTNAACEHLQTAATQFQRSGLGRELQETHALMQ